MSSDKQETVETVAIVDRGDSTKRNMVQTEQRQIRVRLLREQSPQIRQVINKSWLPFVSIYVRIGRGDCNKGGINK